MIVIEDKGTIVFLEDGKEIGLVDGFKRLETLYPNETLENKRVIKRLKKKYLGGWNETYKGAVL